MRLRTLVRAGGAALACLYGVALLSFRSPPERELFPSEALLRSLPRPERMDGTEHHHTACCGLGHRTSMLVSEVARQWSLPASSVRIRALVLPILLQGCGRARCSRCRFLWPARWPELLWVPLGKRVSVYNLLSRWCL